MCFSVLLFIPTEGGSPTVKEEGESLNQLEIFQLILQKQCDALIGLGVDPSIKVP